MYKPTFILFFIFVAHTDHLRASVDEIIKNARQLTFEGARSGEGYFSASGKKLVYQSENFEQNPFYQIYLLDLVSGENKLVSPGIGKTTCAWIHPDERSILYSSTHLDTNASLKQTEELTARKSGKARKYSWDYDRNYELFKTDTLSGKTQRISFADGYDAEGSFSPDGKKIVFASNRNAYSKKLIEEEVEIFDRDKSYFNDIFLMNSDGTGIRQLTHTPGYDGGPFFNNQGDQICWRRFSKNGHKAEIFRMHLESGKEKKLTALNAMSWAPFFHPSNQYLIFSTNLHGFDNFELYAVDIDGQRKPVRITESPGFDGLPSFSPNGKLLSWTSNNTSDKKSQIFIADWNHEQVLSRLALSPKKSFQDESKKTVAQNKATSPQILEEDAKKHLAYLCSDELEGRFTGSKGEKLGSEYVANSFRSYGLEPFSSDGSWFQEFSFFNTAELSADCKLENSSEGKLFKTLEIAKDWTPMPFSESGTLEFDQITFAGYGLRLKKSTEWPEYDSYTHLDVKNKWVMVLRKLPPQWNEKRRQAHYYDSTFRKKASVARDLGAKGIIFVSDFEQPNDKLIEFSASPAKDTISIHAISVTREMASRLFQTNSREFQSWCKKLANGEPQIGFPLKKTFFRLSVSIERKKGIGRNTLGWIRAEKGKVSDQFLVIGAHLDHIGIGKTSSRAKKSQKGKIHPGADDNASGIGALLEIAEYLADLRKRGLLDSLYDVLFVAWSGEEIGLVGSSHFMRAFPAKNDGEGNREIVAYLNLDMVGRYQKKLTLHGVGSSTGWKKIIQQANVPVGLNLNLQNDSHIPTDTTSFFTKGIPILSAFTGLHADYHAPSDTVDKINYKGIADTSKLFSRLIQTLAKQNEFGYVAQAPPPKSRGRLSVYLGTIPDYSQTDKKGVLLSGVSKGGPADLAGIQSEDLIIELEGKKIESIYDYTDAIGLLKPMQKAKIKIMRKQKLLTLSITPSSR
ncbi:MAG: M28 family peptidase [Opitutae bacterium]|jgi:Tol biopolymer transport system component|nr:M28 family peptidase [Opitutae bacterium]